jgi:AAA+ lid domain/ATPase family associated with various cellular activities (AAA)
VQMCYSRWGDIMKFSTRYYQRFNRVSCSIDAQPYSTCVHSTFALHTHILHFHPQFNGVMQKRYTLMLTQCCDYTILLHHDTHTTFTLPQVLMATNRPDTLDPALLRPGRLDRKVEFGLPDLEGRAHILTIHSKTMNVDRDIRYELIARLCPNTTGAELRSVCTEAGMFAIRARKKSISESDFLEAVNKVIKGYSKFSATPKYMVYN